MKAGAIGEIHLAGHATNNADGRAILIDDHGSRVAEAVWGLYARRAHAARSGTDLGRVGHESAGARRAARRGGAGGASLAGRPEWRRPCRRRVSSSVTSRPRCSAAPRIRSSPRSRATGSDPAARLAIYRHHVSATLTEALEATYPVVVRLVDRRFFAYAADQFIRRHPPTGPCSSSTGGARRFSGDVPGIAAPGLSPRRRPARVGAQSRAPRRGRRRARREMVGRAPAGRGRWGVPAAPSVCVASGVALADRPNLARESAGRRSGRDREPRPGRARLRSIVSRMAWCSGRSRRMRTPSGGRWRPISICRAR